MACAHMAPLNNTWYFNSMVLYNITVLCKMRPVSLEFSVLPRDTLTCGGAAGLHTIKSISNGAAMNCLGAYIQLLWALTLTLMISNYLERVLSYDLYRNSFFFNTTHIITRYPRSGGLSLLALYRNVLVELNKKIKMLTFILQIAHLSGKPWRFPAKSLL